MHLIQDLAYSILYFVSISRSSEPEESLAKSFVHFDIHFYSFYLFSFIFLLQSVLHLWYIQSFYVATTEEILSVFFRV